MALAAGSRLLCRAGAGERRIQLAAFVGSPCFVAVGIPRRKASFSSFCDAAFASAASVQHRFIPRLKATENTTKAHASNVNIGESYGEGKDKPNELSFTSPNDSSNNLPKPHYGISYPLSIAAVLLICALVFSIIVYLQGGLSSAVASIAKSGFTAAFSLIFISEIGDKTFFIAALLAMQYRRALVLLGSMGALSFMTVLSVIIGRIFHSVPAQFQTTLPIGEYAAVALLTFFGLKSIKDAWELPSSTKDNNGNAAELGEFVEAEEIVKEKVAKKLTSPLEILWESFSLVFFAEWGDRSMLATIALGAAQSPWGVASGAIVGHLAATSIAIVGGAILANYISEKLVAFSGGVLFLAFAAATLLGVF